MEYQGGQTITVTAEVHQIPLFVRIGAKVALGDLNREYQESLTIAGKRPDLKSLDAEVKAWFDARATVGARK
jgi:alpha-D-xyloside xylohydrolase